MMVLWLLALVVSITSVWANHNNWAVLIDTSAFWFNYRHSSNVLSVYQHIKARGIPDSQIILMLAEDVACNSRNVFPGTIVNNELSRSNLLNGDIEVDYRGAEVSVENLIRLLTNRHPEFTTRNKLLATDENSNILIFMTGHGGDGFLKFRNVEEVSSHDLAGAFEQMWQQKRYREILFIIDTCQAASMYSKFTSPNIYSMASSKIGESSYSYIVDSEIGLSVIDRFSHKLSEFLNDASPSSTIQDLIDSLEPRFLGSTPLYSSELFSRTADKIKVFDFFASDQQTSSQQLSSHKFSFLPFPSSQSQLNNPSIESSNIKQSNEISKRRIYRIKYSGSYSNRIQKHFTLSAFTLCISYILYTSIFKKGLNK